MTSSLEELNEQFVKRYNSGDIKYMSELYTEDCKVMPPGSDVMEGRANVVSTFSEVYASGAKKIKVEVFDGGPVGSPDCLFEICKVTFFKDDGSLFDYGKYVVIKKKQAGKWYYYLDIFNSSQKK